MKIKLDEHTLKLARTKKGGYTAAQVKYAREVTGEKKWKQGVIAQGLTKEEWSKFVSLREFNKKRSVKEKKLNTPKKDTKKSKERQRKAKQKHLDNKAFYLSREWRDLRYRVFKKYGFDCMACGRNKKNHGVIIHIDHIKPRSKHPELELNFDNLQVLCEDCNLGKGNKYEDDFRPDTPKDEQPKEYKKRPEEDKRKYEERLAEITDMDILAEAEKFI